MNALFKLPAEKTTQNMRRLAVGRNANQSDIMNKGIIILVLLLTLLGAAFGQNNKDLNINYMLRGHIYAKSSIEDTVSLGGFGDSDNIPKRILPENNFNENGLFIKIDTSLLTLINEKYNGYRLYIRQ